MQKRRRFDSDDDEREFKDSDDELLQMRLLNRYAAEAGPAEEAGLEIPSGDHSDRLSVAAEDSALSKKDAAVTPQKNDSLNSFVQLEDLDISFTHFSVLPCATLLSAYLTPLHYLKEKKDCDSLLLTNYVPSSRLATEKVTKVPLSLNLQPGWRWDGVQRGRRKS